MRHLPALLALCVAPLVAQANPAENDAAMRKLATDSGCMDCHTAQRAPLRADGLPPIAPAWSDVAQRYRDDPTAYRKLTQTVMTGADPAKRHWVAKTGPGTMPSNAQQISEADAQMLVNWLLARLP